MHLQQYLLIPCTTACTPVQQLEIRPCITPSMHSQWLMTPFLALCMADLAASGPNTLVGLAKGDNKGTYDPSALIRKLVPTYMSLMEQLKSMGVPEVGP